MLQGYDLIPLVSDPFVPAAANERWGGHTANARRDIFRCQTISNHIANLPRPWACWITPCFPDEENATFINTGRGARKWSKRT
jgi:hypothetical protein